jgi:DNA-binding LacI/PurR family transcriptional regulator
MTAGTQLMADHIGKLGYKNLLIVKGKENLQSDFEIIDSFKEALRGKAEINKPMLIEIGSIYSAGEPDFSELEKYLRPPYRTEIIVVVQSKNVYPIMTWLQKHNVRIPQDVALVALEEGPGFDLVHSPVTALRKPLTAIAVKVANMIWSEVKNGGKGKYRRQVNMTPELVVRKSCGSNK